MDISAGAYFCTAIDSESSVWVWGRGEYGVLGTGKNEQLATPTLNKTFEELKTEVGLKVKTIKSTKNSSLALMGIVEI